MPPGAAAYSGALLFPDAVFPAPAGSDQNIASCSSFLCAVREKGPTAEAGPWGYFLFGSRCFCSGSFGEIIVAELHHHQGLCGHSVALLHSGIIPLGCQICVLFHAQALVVALTQTVHGLNLAVVGSFAEPLGGLCVVLFHAQALAQQVAAYMKVLLTLYMKSV